MAALAAACVFLPQQIAASQGPSLAQSDDAPALKGGEWRWQETLFNDDSRVTPPQTGRFTLTFGADGALRVQADCNAAGGTYTTQENRLTLEVTHATMAACPPDSLDTEFLRQLSEVNSYLFKGGRLVLELRYDTGTMIFSR